MRRFVGQVRQSVTGILAVAIIGLACPGYAGIGFQSVAPGNTRWALVVHTGPEGTQEAKGLAEILKDSFGFRPENTYELYDGDATLENIREAMFRIYENIGTDDVLFVHLSMSMRREEGRAAFISSDFSTDSPWLSLDVAEAMDWLINMPEASILVTYPSCSEVGDNSRETYELGRIQRTERRNTVDFLFVCNQAGMRMEQQYTGDEIVSSGHERGVLSSSMARVLKEVARFEFNWITSDDLMYRLGDSSDFYYVNIAHSSTYQPSTFAFVVAPSELSRYKTDYRQATTLEGRERVLYVLANVAAEGGQLELPAVEFLAAVAIDPSAKLNVQDLDSRIAMKLRWLSVDLLSRVDRSSAKSALAKIMVEATDEASLRRRALSRLVPRLHQDDSSDMALLMHALEDPDATVRGEAVRSVSLVGYVPAADAIWNVVETDEDLVLRVNAIQTLTDLLEADASSAESQVNSKQYGEKISAFITEVEAPEELRISAIHNLPYLDVSSTATDALVRLLKRDDNIEVRAASAFALGKSFAAEKAERNIGEAAASKSIAASRNKAVKQLLSATKDDSQLVRESAAHSLAEIGDPRAARSLLRLLETESNSPSVRVAATEGLGSLPARQYARQLRVAAREAEPVAVRVAAMTALATMNDPEAVSILLSSVADDNEEIRRSARDTLESMQIDTYRVVEQGITSNSGEVRAESVRLLGRSGNDDDALLIIGLLRDRDPEVRSAVISSLSNYDSARADAAILSALRDSPDPYVRGGAALVLGNVADPATLPALKGASADPDPNVREAAVRAIGRFDDPEAIELVIKAASSDEKNTSVRVAAVETLGRMQPYNSDDIVFALEQLARGDRSAYVRRAAIQALSTDKMSERAYDVESR